MNKKLFLTITSILYINFGLATRSEILINPSYKSLTMSEAVALSEKHKPSIHAYQQAMEVALTIQQSKMVGYLPVVTATENIYNTGNYTAATGSARTSLGINASQLIYNFAGPQLTHKIAGKDVRKAEHNKKIHQDAIRKEVETAFLNAWLVQQKERLMTRFLKSFRETFKKNKHQNELDILDKNEWLKTNVTYAKQMSIVQQYRDEVAIAEQSLSYLTGQNYKLSKLSRNNSVSTTLTKLAWSPKKETHEKTFKECFEIALQHRNEIKYKNAEIEKKNLEKKFYMRSYLPSVSLFGTYSRGDRWNSTTYDTKSAGVSVSWRMFDGLYNYFNKNIAEGNKIKIELDKQDLVQQIKLEVQTALSQLNQSQENIKASSVAYKQAKNEFLLKHQEFKLGSLSKTDYETIKYNWENAEFSYLSAETTLAIKKRNLEHACGYPVNL